MALSPKRVIVRHLSVSDVPDGPGMATSSEESMGGAPSAG